MRALKDYFHMGHGCAATDFVKDHMPADVRAWLFFWMGATGAEVKLEQGRLSVDDAARMANLKDYFNGRADVNMRVFKEGMPADVSTWLSRRTPS